MMLWDTKARIYDHVRELPVLKSIYLAESHNLQKLLPGKSFRRHLDLGSGTGVSLRIFQNSERIILSDLSPKMLFQARQQIGMPGVLLDARAVLPFRSAAFDLITAVGLLEYLRDLRAVFLEIYRVAAENAYFLFTSSPPGLATFLRAATGARPHAHTARSLQPLVVTCGWRVVGFAKSWMQEQWLCQKKGMLDEAGSADFESK